MPDREKVIKGLEQFKSDFKPFCGNSADWKRVDDAIAMIDTQYKLILELQNLISIGTKMMNSGEVNG